MLRGIIHKNEYLIYNVDETSVCANRKGKLVVLEGKTGFESEEQLFGHITAVLTCNAAGESLRPLLILPSLLNRPNELKDLQPQCLFCSSPTGWDDFEDFFNLGIVFYFRNQ